MIWGLFAALSGLALLALLAPLLRKGPGRAVASDGDFYRAQLAEIEAGRRAGRLGAAEAESARVETARRLLAATGAPAPVESRSRPRRAFVLALVIATFVPALALGLYARLGRPAAPDMPLASRAAPPGQDIGMAEAVARIERHLAANPDDGRGYEVLAPVYLRTGRLDDAVRAFAAALRLNGETAARLAALGEARIMAAGGVVTAEARRDLERALELDAGEPRARYYLALAAEQDGDHQKARAALEALLAAAPPGAAEIAKLPPAERDKAIRGMVDGLAARLAGNGKDKDGWIRLVRSYRTLGETVKAREALAAARRALDGEPDARAALDGLARELGLGG